MDKQDIAAEFIRITDILKEKDDLHVLYDMISDKTKREFVLGWNEGEKNGNKKLD